VAAGRGRRSRRQEGPLGVQAPSDDAAQHSTQRAAAAISPGERPGTAAANGAAAHLALPDPQHVTLAAVRTEFLPRIVARREAIRDRASLADALELARRVEAFHRYLRDREVRDLLAAEARRTEVLVGHLLGPGERGNPQFRGEPAISPAGEIGVVPTDDRYKFRLLAEHEPYVEQWLSEGIVARAALLAKIRQLARQAPEEADAPAVEAAPAASDRYRVIHADIADALEHVEPESIDFIVTDPPYPREYLPLYDTLSGVAACVLRPGGSLLAMVGQSYFPEIVDRLGASLTYHWTLAYLTPGGQAVQLWQRKVNTFWKPVLWFTKGEYAGDWVGDVCRSGVNDNDKRFHDWGQSESGMADLIERFTYPGQTILDPFMGAGTTGVVAVRLNRVFVGLDLDAAHVETARRRLAAAAA
jgi:hypothetical protein